MIGSKKDRTLRAIVAQVLDDASWVRTLTTPEIYERAERYLASRLVTAFRERFGEGKALDLAVTEADSWGDDWRPGLLTEYEILSRLFTLNQERAAI